MKQLMVVSLLLGLTLTSAWAETLENQTVTGQKHSPELTQQGTITVTCAQKEEKLNLQPLELKFAGIRVYTEPSHTLIAAGVNEAYPQILQATQQENPYSLVMGSSEALESMHAQLTGITFSETDNHIVIVGMIDHNGNVSTKELSKIWLSSFSDFGYQVGFSPDGEGCYVTGWCGNPQNSCGPILCNPCDYTLCCPNCTLHCGMYVCP